MRREKSDQYLEKGSLSYNNDKNGQEHISKEKNMALTLCAFNKQGKTITFKIKIE